MSPIVRGRARKVTWEIVRGDTMTMAVNFVDGGGAPINVAASQWEAAWAPYAGSPTPPVELSVDVSQASTGRVVVVADDDVTSTLAQPGVWWLSEVAGGEPSTVLDGPAPLRLRGAAGTGSGSRELTVTVGDTEVTVTLEASTATLGTLVDAAVAAHNADTTAVHGIANTAALATTSGVASAVAAHAAASDPHGDRAYAAGLVDDLSGVTAPAAARTALGLGSIATQAASAVAITGGTITGITDLAVADGGTGASTAAGARARLGVADWQRSNTLAPVRRRLAVGQQPLVAVLVGDSTGNDSTDWPRQMLTKSGGLIDQFPAWTVRHLLWSDAMQAHAPPVTFAVGSAGLANLRLNGGKHLETPAPAWATTGNQIHSVRCFLPSTGITGAENVLASRFGASGNRSWRFYLAAGGTLAFDYSSNGTAIVGATSGPLPSAALDAWVWLQARAVMDDGAGGGSISLWWSANEGASWTQIGATTTLGAPSSVFASTAKLMVGARDGGPAGVMTEGYVSDYVAESGIHGSSTYAGGVSVGMLSPGTGILSGYRGETWTVVGAPTLAGAPQLTFFNGSHPGSVVAYADDGTRFPKLCPIPPDLAIVNYGHNETSEPGAWTAAVDAVVARFRALNARAPVLASIQNPQQTGATNPPRHARRCQALFEHALRSGWAPVDAFRRFVEHGDWSPLMLDAVHPNADGYAVWADEALDVLAAGR